MEDVIEDPAHRWKAHLNNHFLSPRQTQFAFWSLLGMTDKEMAKELAISHDTIRQKVKQALHKYHLKNRTQLVAELIRHKVIEPVMVFVLTFSIALTSAVDIRIGIKRESDPKREPARTLHRPTTARRIEKTLTTLIIA
ncbi:response regulator transcription factor [Zooshikella ganghwensis]|uniref:LuxR family transcriptional regulator n=1 Tax=Zooshikella ganghwensis TaxID=202772 RepID=A0A4P9VHC6_9GAMM|nr:helix-turn-helix transcriptional regulator [Zooshikella ganghwensis]RDH41620.1 LuxR family transcriptional regulator [Zooshikella ganghwensis]